MPGMEYAVGLKKGSFAGTDAVKAQLVEEAGRVLFECETKVIVP